jgi:hypothetical protein
VKILSQGRGGAFLILLCVAILQTGHTAYAQSVKIAWDPVSSTSLAGYRVYRSEQTGTFPSTPLNSTLTTTNSYTDSTVQAGHTYFYVTAAVDTTGLESQFSNQIQATVPAAATNQPPTATVPPVATITLPATATLTVTATDDGLPNGTLSYGWSVVNATGVAFANPTSPTTSATFAAAGTYTVRATVSDGLLSTSVDVSIVVAPPPALSLLVSKSGVLLRGSVTSISESTTDPRATKLAIFIDGQLRASGAAPSLTYKWDLRKVSGNHTIQGEAYDATNALLQTKTITVRVR